ncbi:hypothetical protein IQ22_03391 [Pseudomonas duriflava]|uniref:Uncharacterized protein n=1 Tax=Pseudomonas duriflava TaxID=459528 RepID=A0A562Q789_9PSED|nr:hypothetical protein [Pseudomonas duriflava]TWI52621.1 hypothetical protein IQ22_03391 [Pseudomonas duriflava]
MHFLIMQSQYGHKLVSYNKAVFELKKALSELKERNAANTPMILDEKVVKSTYLCNDTGMPVQEIDGYLIRLAEL